MWLTSSLTAFLVLCSTLYFVCGLKVSPVLYFWKQLILWIVFKPNYDACIPWFSGVENKRMRIHVYCLALQFYLWDKPHYRKGSYGQDLSDNLRNVAIPGTGVSLKVLTLSKYFVALPFMLFGIPTLAFVNYLHLLLYKKETKESAKEAFYKVLLESDDWFSLWRVNCTLVALHSYMNKNPVGYKMENKWAFLERGKELDIPVSPYRTDVKDLVIKHRNEEGGMGIHFFKNATVGGDWIIQERIYNSNFVNSMLPENAPLSTFRIITMSLASISPNDSFHENNIDAASTRDEIRALSCVFRAGRKDALTDHDSILFDVDMKTGKILKGSTNSNWYKIGLSNVVSCPWRTNDESQRISKHPDGDVEVTGKVIKELDEMLELVESSHASMCPDVPLVGWDVVLSSDNKCKICLLEVNLSCNFFRGSFDQNLYYDFLDESFATLSERI